MKSESDAAAGCNLWACWGAAHVILEDTVGTSLLVGNPVSGRRPGNVPGREPACVGDEDRGEGLCQLERGQDGVLRADGNGREGKNVLNTHVDCGVGEGGDEVFMGRQVGTRVGGELVGNHVPAGGCLEAESAGAGQDEVLVGGGSFDSLIEHDPALGDVEVLVDKVDREGLFGPRHERQ